MTTGNSTNDTKPLMAQTKLSTGKSDEVAIIASLQNKITEENERELENFSAHQTFKYWRLLVLFTLILHAIVLEFIFVAGVLIRGSTENEEASIVAASSLAYLVFILIGIVAWTFRTTRLLNIFIGACFVLLVALLVLLGFAAYHLCVICILNQQCGEMHSIIVSLVSALGITELTIWAFACSLTIMYKKLIVVAEDLHSYSSEV